MNKSIQVAVVALLLAPVVSSAACVTGTMRGTWHLFTGAPPTLSTECTLTLDTNGYVTEGSCRERNINGTLAQRFRGKAARLKNLIQEQLWDERAEFFKVLPRGTNASLAAVRKLHGLTPWYFNLPDSRFTVAWKQLMNPKGFFAPFGPTPTEQRHPGFKVAYAGHECQWNGPSWPYSTAVTLVGLANLLNGPEQSVVSRSDYVTVLRNYALSHRLKRPDGKVVPWIDENLNPFTGVWIARTLCTDSAREQNPRARQGLQPLHLLRSGHQRTGRIARAQR